MPWILKDITKSDLEQRVKQVTSFRQLMLNIGLKGGGSYRKLVDLVKKYEIDTSHFTGQTWNKGQFLKLENEVFCKNSQISISYVKKVFISKLNTDDIKCQICEIKDWCNQKIIFELDHINGDNSDHSISNLRLLCPNCHSQTPTWRGRNKNNGKQKVSDQELITALKKFPNIRKALISVGLVAKGANYTRCKMLLSKKV